MTIAGISRFLLKEFCEPPEDLGVLTTQPRIDETAGLRTPQEVDAELAAELYGPRAHELITFFYRRTRDADSSAQLLAETFATAALRRRKDPSLSVRETEWLQNIARLELSRYFRKLKVELVHVSRLGIDVPLLTPLEKTVLDAEVRMLSESARLGVRAEASSAS